MSNYFLFLFSANHLNHTLELNESANHLAKTQKKETRKEMSANIADKHLR